MDIAIGELSLFPLEKGLMGRSNCSTVSRRHLASPASPGGATWYGKGYQLWSDLVRAVAVVSCNG